MTRFHEPRIEFFVWRLRRVADDPVPEQIQTFCECDKDLPLSFRLPFSVGVLLLYNFDIGMKDFISAKHEETDQR